ncbi:MFS transporter [Arthrobacter sp. HMWF013]|uniref:MFS transporter n=1 Tax=Arthrobacter sp. HMWF013 TaxID=2056849 RepID=UPI000D368AFA|nr:MFS transporter [Arthrobacter sp. HMWF013]PTT70786.1 MFS transporter [Arthrobacter sp. HMWF013]
MLSSTSQTTATVQSAAKRPLFAASSGTFIEFFDYGSYSYLATTIAAVFFPPGNPTVALVQTFALFALSFAMRPIGALFWGHFGDRIGRKRALALTIIGIGLATTCIGLLPGYATIGFWAPVLLVLLRFLQSFCTAGEYTGAAILVVEYAPADKRARYISSVAIGCAVGFLAASVVSTLLNGLLDEDAMNTWGWRIPFLLAAPMTLVGVYLRNRIDETPVFRAAQEKGELAKLPLVVLFREHWRALLRTLAIMGVNATGYYLVLGYMQTYLEVEVGLSGFEASIIMTTSLLVYLPMLYGGAYLSDRFGRKTMLMANAVLFLVLSYPIFLLLGISGFAAAMAIQILFVGIFSLNDSTIACFFTESFPAKVRYSGSAIPTNVGVAIFGGTGPLVASWLIAQTGDNTMPAFVMMFVALIGAVALIFTKETKPTKAEAAALNAATAEAEAKVH